MRRVLEVPTVLTGFILAAARPPWTAATEDQVVAAVWASAIVLWSWLVVVGGIHAWATRTGRARWLRLTGRLLPSGVRRRVEHLAVAGLLVVPVAACSAESGTRAAPVLILEESVPLPSTTLTTPTTSPSVATTTTTIWSPLPDITTTTSAAAPETTTAPPAPPTDAGDPPSSPAPSPPAPPLADRLDQPGPADDPTFTVPLEPGTHVVVRGDNLWDIAAEHLAATIPGARPSADQVRSYWLDVIEANRGQLRSGDPDLIHPGELVQLPAVRSA